MAKKETATQEHNPAVGKTGFARKGALVVPTISIKNMKEGDALAIKCVSEPHYEVSKDEKTGEKLYNKDGTEKMLGTCRVVNLMTGELGQIVLSAIVDRAFKDFIAEHGGVTGRCFELVRGKSLGTGKANLWEIYEIEEA